MMPSLSSLSHTRYQPPALFLIGLISIILALDDTWSGLLSIWLVFDESYGHGLLVAAASLVLAGRALINNPAIALSPNPWLAIPLFFAALLISLSAAIGVDLLQYLLLPVVILLAYALLAGTAQARRLLVPVALLYFALPFWDYLNNALVEITSAVVQYFVARSGITAHIAGNSIFIPSGEIIIASGCSGLRYFIIGTFLGGISSYLNFTSYKRSILLIAGLAFLSLVANWVRVYGITLVAYRSEMQSPLVNDHEMLGWVLFMFFMMPLLYLNGRYGPVVTTPADTHTTVTDYPSSPSPHISGNPRRIVYAFVLLFLSVSIAPYLLNRSIEIDTSSSELLELTSLNTTGWQQAAYTPVREEWQPRIEVPDVASVNRYSQQAQALVVYQYLYVKQGAGEEILPYVNTLYDRDNWVIVTTREMERYNLLQLVHKISQRQILAAYVFNVGGLTTSNYLLAKLYQFPAIVRQRPYALFTAIVADCAGDCSAADELMARFINGR